MDALVTSERIAEPRLNGRPQKSSPKGKDVGSCDEEEPETSQNEPLETIDLGSFAVLSDHGDTVEDDVDVDECSEEDTGIMPPLPPASLFKESGTSKHTEVHCWMFRKPCNGDRRDEESPFFDCWDWKHEQYDVLQQVDPWAQVCAQCKKLPFSELPCLFCVPEVGCVPTFAPQYDISSEGKGRPDDVP